MFSSNHVKDLDNIASHPLSLLGNPFQK